jgi:hypothetical protein
MHYLQTYYIHPAHRTEFGYLPSTTDLHLNGRTNSLNVLMSKTDSITNKFKNWMSMSNQNYMVSNCANDHAKSALVIISEAWVFKKRWSTRTGYWYAYNVHSTHPNPFFFIIHLWVKFVALLYINNNIW